MLERSTRRLTDAERDGLAARRAALRERLEADARASKRTQIEAVRRVAAIAGAFALIVAFNLGWGSTIAALAVGAGVLAPNQAQNQKAE